MVKAALFALLMAVHAVAEMPTILVASGTANTGSHVVRQLSASGTDIATYIILHLVHSFAHACFSREYSEKATAEAQIEKGPISYTPHLLIKGNVKVRCMTRNKNSDKAKELAKLPNVEIYEADFEDERDMDNAMEGQ